MKGTILETAYCPGEDNISNSGFSYLRKQTKYGIFDATVFLAEEDVDIDNSWDGLHFAEYKCDYQAQKEKAKRLYQRALGIKHCYNVLKDSIDIEDPIMKKIERQMEVAFHEADKCNEKVKRMKLNYKNYVQHQLNERRRIRQSIKKD